MFKTLIIIYRWSAAIIGMLIFGTLGLVLIYMSFGLLRPFFVKYVYRYGARILLKIFGYTFDLPSLESFPKKQVVYTINHNSYLDIFLLTSLGLPNTWYVISELIYKFPYLVITCKALGTLFIPQKKHPGRRLKFFLRTTEFLKKGKNSLIVSAEGVREYIHGIQPFNKGIFHMAMEAGLPIVPMYIHIPEDVNPYKGKFSKTGHIHLELLEEVDTSAWALESISDEIARVRKRYLDRFDELNNTDIKYLHPLSEPLNEQHTGGKASGLSKIKACGMLVPEGFVIDSKAHPLYLKEKRMPDQLKHEIALALADLASERIIVRSSAIGEDGKEHSFAGQLDSFVTGKELDEVCAGVLSCWESLGNERVRAYTLMSGIELTEMGVVIQEFVEAAYSGVLFTKSPRGNGSIYCEYVQGAAEPLVSGKVTPESFHADQDAKLGKNDPPPFDHTSLVKQALKLRDHFGTELDIEWICRGKHFYFVQARPISRTAEEKVFWTNTNLNENYPDPMSPLLYSIAKDAYYHYFKNLSRQLQIRKESLEDLESDFRNSVGKFGERIYYNMTSVHNILAASPFHRYFQNAFNNFVGYQESRASNKEFRKKSPLLRSGINLILLNIGLEKHVRKTEKNVTDFVIRASNAGTTAAHVSSYDEFLDLRFNEWYHAGLADFFSMLHYNLLGSFTRRFYGEEAQGVHNTLIQAIPGLISNEPLLASWKILEEIGKIKGGTQLFEESKPEDILDTISNDPAWERVNEMMDDYLEAWGFRCSGELMFLNENYIESPLKFIELLRAYLLCGHKDPKVVIARKDAERRQFMRTMERRIFRKRHLLFPVAFVEVIILRTLTGLCRKAIMSRERVRYQQARMYYHFKQTAFRIGEVLVLRGLLENHRDVLYLTYQEVRDLLVNSEGAVPGYPEEIGKRKAAFYSGSKQEYPVSFETLRGRVLEKFDMETSDVRKEFSGLAASGGKIKARVKVLDSVLEATKIEAGEILVTKQTDPGWAMVFPIIGGIIVERGGALSHGAIVAREFGIPAVVGLEGITKVLKDNDEVIIDGDSGKVQLL